MSEILTKRHSTHGSGDEDGSFAESEVLERLFALVLRTIAVDRLGRVSFLVEKLLQLLRTLLRLHEHQRQRVWTCAVRLTEL